MRVRCVEGGGGVLQFRNNKLIVDIPYIKAGVANFAIVPDGIFVNFGNRNFNLNYSISIAYTKIMFDYLPYNIQDT